QVDVGSGPVVSPSAVASGHYALAQGEDRLWGATFEAFHGGEPAISEQARMANAAARDALVGEGWSAPGDVRSRASVRATTPDRLPFVGPAPDYAACIERFAGVRQGRVPTDAPAYLEGIYLMGGLGSRGFTFAPWLADELCAQICGGASAMPRSVGKLISPMRFIFRKLKRRQA
ncbi:MAG: FAD-dependent oxidoreductase, partial [Pseudomonadota bacterium]